jgi:UPF0716 protein FxsA
LLRHFPAIVFGLFLVELASLIWLGARVGVLAVLGLVVLDVLIGGTLIRRSGANIFVLMNTRSIDKKAISSGAANSLFDAAAGLFFIIPGLVSDLAGLVLLTPFLRRRLARMLEGQIVAEYPHRRNSNVVIDAEATEIIDPPKLNSNSPAGN